MNPSITSMLQQLASEGIDPVSVEALSRLAGSDVARLERSIKRFRLGDPLPYITRSVQAMGREFFVDRRVYRPSAERPTEPARSASERAGSCALSFRT